MCSSPLSVRLFLATVGCFAALQPAQAQQAELSFAGGGLLSRSNFSLASGSPTLNSVFSLKSGVVFAQKWGLGLFYERTNLTSEVTHSIPTKPEETYYSYEVIVTDPQHSLGLEVYRKVALTPKTHLRFGALLGYAWGRVYMPAQPGGVSKTGGASLAGGLDAHLVFPLLNRLAGIAGTGLRISHLQYKVHPEQTKITTVGVPFSVGLSYTFGQP